MKERINKDFLEAFKNKDVLRKNLLGVIKGEIQNEELRGKGEVDVMSILKRMEKSLKATNTPESLLELEILKVYLPETMSDLLLTKILINYHEILGLNTMGEMMSQFNKEYKGEADGKTVSNIIKNILV